MSLLKIEEKTGHKDMLDFYKVSNPSLNIERSENLSDLLGALSKFQGKIENAKKDKVGFNNRYKYADLNQYIEISKDLLAENGLSILQIPGGIEIIEVTNESNQKQFLPKQKLTTWLGHESGQFISGTMEMIVEKTKSNSWGQSTGSAISYMRRYGISAILSMSQEDDDNIISKKENERYSPLLPCPVPSKIDKKKADYLKELIKDDPPRLEKILEWASTKQNQKVSAVEEMSVEIYNAAINFLLNEKIKLLNEETKEEINKKNENLISVQQADFMKSIITTDMLNQVLSNYNIKNLEEMGVDDYNIEYDKLRFNKEERLVEKTINAINIG